MAVCPCPILFDCELLLDVLRRTLLAYLTRLHLSQVNNFQKLTNSLILFSLIYSLALNLHNVNMKF